MQSTGDITGRSGGSSGPSSGGLAGSWRSLLLGIVVGVVGVMGVGLVVGGPLIIAHRTDLPLERLYGSYAVSLIARLSAGSEQNPLAGNRRALISGRDAYTGSCAQCHGAKGDGRGVFGQATYPQATDLTSHDAKEKSDAELFWITKNGLSFTGMPGFGNQYDDQQIWAIVTYIRALQNGQPQAIAVPTPTSDQLAMANPTGSAVERGAAVYYAAGCHTCHGAVGNAPGELALFGAREVDEAVRRGRRGMPAYSQDQISDADLADLAAYMSTFSGQRQGLAPGQFRRLPSNGEGNL
jgi:mono/diheme cytochrome c family protein